MAGFRVTLDALVAGNPNKAWKEPLPEGETSDDVNAPDRQPPDDVWESQVYSFGDIDTAKTFIEGLPAGSTTHVVLEYDDGSGNWELLFNKDADAESLPEAAPGVTPPYLVDSPLPFEDDAIEEAPPLMPSQGTP